METDFNKICRICFKNELLYSINTTISFNLPLRSIINYLNFFKIQIVETETQLPSTLCQSCVYRLLDAYNLKQQCESSESKLKHYLQTTSTTQYPYISAKGFSTLFKMSTISELADKENLQQLQEIGHFSTTCPTIISPLIHAPSLLPPQTDSSIKGQDCEIFNTMNEIFAETQNSEDIEVTDDVLNEVEIDVSSLTRSDFNDEVIQQTVSINNFSNKIHNRIDSNVIEFNTNIKDTLVKKNNIIALDYQNFTNKTDLNRQLCLKNTKNVENDYQLLTKNTSNTGKLIIKDKKIFECHECHKILKTFSHFEAHKRIHSGVKPYKCNRCPKSFTQIGNYNLHMNNVHLERRRYQCEICSKLFTTSSNLKQHKITHINVKHFKCLINNCKKQFRSNNELKNHQKIHSNVKNFNCPNCHKTFLKKSYLKLHDRIVHKGERPYKCKQCLKEFSRSCNLIAHERIHTGIKPYLCKFCNSKFNQSSALRRHLKTCNLSKLKNSSSKILENLILNPCKDESKKISEIIYNVDNLIVPEYSKNQGSNNQIEDINQHLHCLK